MSTRRALCLAAAAWLAAAAGCIVVSPFAGMKPQETVVEKSPRFIEWNRIALIEVDGFISSSDGFGFFWPGTTVADVKEKLNRAAEDRRVKAVIIRIDSPGGEVAASDMIHEETLRFQRTTGKPVVAMLMGTAASGGYYVATAANCIIASPTTVTGSIGVVMNFTNLEGLYGKLGLKPEVIKSGEKKDIGSPTRPLTPEERELLQNINRDFFDRFLQVVRAGRPAMTPAELEKVSDGRVLTARQALELRMVDKIGYLADAVAAAKELAGIGGADVVAYKRTSGYNANMYSGTESQMGLIQQGLELLLRRHGAAFLYLWSPGA